MKLKRLAYLAFTFSIPCFLQAQQAKMNIGIEAGQLNFDVSFKGQPVILSSPLGMNIDNHLLGKEVKNSTVSTTSGKYKTYTIEQKDGNTYYIDSWEFNDGVALRYRIPSDGPRCIYGEQTAYTFPSGTHVWYASGPFQYGWIQAYQDRSTDSIKDELLAPPATFLLPNGTYAAITEANLFNFHGAVLFGKENNRVQFGYVENKGHVETGIITGLPDSKFWHEEVRNIPWITSPRNGENEIVTPWRVLMLAEDLNGLVNNQIIAQVSDRPDPTLFPKGKDTEWIKPGRSVFTWLTEGNDRLSVANHKKYVDGAAELGLQSVVVDDGWELWEETEKNTNGRSKWELLKELTDYGKAKNVDIWVWRPSSPRSGNKTDIGLVDADERSGFMKKCAEAGVKGLKIDFFHTENLFTVNLMENILKDAAKAHLMVIFHGVNKPTGDSYTYPNLLAKEAVRGLESVGAENSWAPGPAWPYHNTVLPFTRWLAGPADYTPLNFRKFCPPSVTFTHQLASIYTFTSPMLIFAADMEDMLSCPGRMFIEEVPVVWDETKVLPESRIGKLAALVRRSGDTWYLSVLNGETPYKGKLQTDFLPKGTYRMTIASDEGSNYKKIVISNRKIKSGKTLQLDLLPGGGYLAKIEKI
ncbi:glycoside hydrolase family 97 protein [Phocaeicola massiliensis]|jgi:alpha-glucosidase|uniref:glycoside hydrolase family 97 protein n=1 Tax=Phocaeicola massiliensis TaxID=204516 RepID=UPI001C383DB8|nr:glycoside hydrolase family 97 protein [Phocaeicola massiliensis]MBV3496462.1 glycoside hydrolase family 97 protein [Phocaeicola massiliensis]